MEQKMDSKKTITFGAEYLAEVEPVAGLGSGRPVVRIYGGAARAMVVLPLPCPIDQLR